MLLGELILLLADDLLQFASACADELEFAFEAVAFAQDFRVRFFECSLLLAQYFELREHIGQLLWRSARAAGFGRCDLHASNRIGEFSASRKDILPHGFDL